MFAQKSLYIELNDSFVAFELNKLAWKWCIERYIIAYISRTPLSYATLKSLHLHRVFDCTEGALGEDPARNSHVWHIILIAALQLGFPRKLYDTMASLKSNKSTGLFWIHHTKQGLQCPAASDNLDHVQRVLNFLLTVSEGLSKVDLLFFTTEVKQATGYLADEISREREVFEHLELVRLLRHLCLIFAIYCGPEKPLN